MYAELSEGERNEIEAESEAARNYESEQWSRLEQLLAGLKDELQAFRWGWESSKTKGKMKWQAEPTPRPGVKPKKKKRKATKSELDKLWAHLNQMERDN